jgi:NUMOD3 motif
VWKFEASMSNIFYVYEHWRPDRGECFYVGKGHGRRAYDMRRGRNRWHKFMTAKLSALGTAVEIKIISEGLTEEEAFAKEVERIEFWKNDGADLCNLTLGGDGPSGRRHSEEWKRANGERMRGRKASPETRAKQSAAAMGNKKGLGKKRPQHAIDATAAAQRGIPKNVDHLRKLADAKRGKPGTPFTEEQKAESSARQKGIPKPEWVKERMRKPKGEEHRRKLSVLMTGVKRSAETRAKIAENSRIMWAQKKAAKALATKE